MLYNWPFAKEAHFPHTTDHIQVAMSSIAIDPESPTQIRDNVDIGRLNRCCRRIALLESILKGNERELAECSKRKASLLLAAQEFSSTIATLKQLKSDRAILFSSSEPISERVDMATALNNLVEATETAAEYLDADIDHAENSLQSIQLELDAMWQALQRCHAQKSALEITLQRRQVDTAHVRIKMELE